MSHPEKLSSIVRAFSNQEIDREKFINKLKTLEGLYWHFALDNNHLLLRNEFSKAIIDIDPKNHTYTLRFKKVATQNESNILPPKSTKKIIGILGAARNLKNPQEAERQLEELFSSLNPAEVIILTGGFPNPEGIPRIAQRLARKYGLKVIVIAPKVIFQSEFIETLSEQDFLVTVGDEWADETPTLVEAADILYIVGEPGYWTLIEIETAAQMKKEMIFLNKKDDQ